MFPIAPNTIEKMTTLNVFYTLVLALYFIDQHTFADRLHVETLRTVLRNIVLIIPLHIGIILASAWV